MMSSRCCSAVLTRRRMVPGLGVTMKTDVLLHGEAHDCVVAGLVVRDAEGLVGHGVAAAQGAGGMAADVARLGAVGNACGGVSFNGRADHGDGLAIQQARVTALGMVQPDGGAAGDRAPGGLVDGDVFGLSCSATGQGEHVGRVGSQCRGLACTNAVHPGDGMPRSRRWARPGGSRPRSVSQQSDGLCRRPYPDWPPASGSAAAAAPPRGQ